MNIVHIHDSFVSPEKGFLVCARRALRLRAHARNSKHLGACRAAVVVSSVQRSCCCCVASKECPIDGDELETRRARSAPSFPEDDGWTRTYYVRAVGR